MNLRAATIADADMLLSWRNDPQTRAASHNTDEVTLAEHRAWLERILANPSRKLFIAEDDGVPVGTCRADFSANGCELSWTLAPEARGNGVASRMVVMLASQIPGPVRAEVKIGNDASAAVARRAGMALVRTADGVLHFERR